MLPWLFVVFDGLFLCRGIHGNGICLFKECVVHLCQQVDRKRSFFRFPVGGPEACFYFILNCSGFSALCREVESALYSLGRWVSPHQVTCVSGHHPQGSMWWTTVLQAGGVPHCIRQLHAAGHAALAKPLRDSAALSWDGLGWERPIHAFMALFSAH